MAMLSATATAFFVLRSPRLSRALLENLPSSYAGLDDVLQRFVNEPAWQEALYLASPSLLERASSEFSQHQQFSQKTRLALIKYLIRMTSRPTPFGLFAAVSLGQFADSTTLTLGHWRDDRKVSRLDMEYLYRLRQQLSQHSALQAALCYRLNPTFQQMGSAGHYIEPYHTQGQQYRLSAVETDEVLLQICQSAVVPQRLRTLADALQQQFSQYSTDELLDYLTQLVQERLLLPELPLPLTGSRAELAFIDCLNGLDALAADPELAEIPTQLSAVVQTLQQLDKQQSAAVSAYRAIWQQLQQLPCPVQENKLIQTDLFRPLQHNQLAASLQAPLARALLALQALQGAAPSPFTDFISQFQRRFEGQAVPLLALLNEENGIAFSSETGYETPLLAGIQIRRGGRAQATPPSPTVALERLLDSKILQHSGKVLQLHSDELLAGQTDLQALWQRLPMSFATTVSVYQSDEPGQTLVHLHGCSGPSGANLLGRFCHLDDELLQQVRQYLAAEQQLCPQVLLAELVHAPDGRPGNVIARPQLRADEIVFLADSALPASAQIAVSDLLVYVEDNKVKLWSQSLQQQVLPRLSCAHNFSQRSLGIYRFLAMLGHQYGQPPRFSVPPAWQQASRTPRVMLDQVILAEASWLIPLERLKGLLDGDDLNQQAWQVLCAEYQLDEWVSYAIADHVLTIRLTHPPMLQVLLQECRQQRAVRLKEVLALQHPSLVAGADGQYMHELVIPWLNPASQLPVSLTAPASIDTQSNRRFGAGSEWLSLKLYASASQAELLLLQLAPLFNQWQQQQRIRGWFFIRYGDPDWHLRLRFHGEPAALCLLLPELWRLLQPALQSQQLHKLEVFTYEQEQERYGGPVAINLAQQLFCFDSQLVSAVLQIAAAEGDSWRVRAQVALVFNYLQLLLPEPTAQLALLSQLRDAFGKEFQEHVQLRQQFGQKFRDYQRLLKADLRETATDETSQQLYQLLAQFRQQSAPVAAELQALAQANQLTVSLPGLLGSLLHMSLNRLSKVYGREQELVIYDFCRRLLLAQLQQTPALSH